MMSFTHHRCIYGTATLQSIVATARRQRILLGWSIPAFIIASFIASSPVQALDVCSLVSQSEMAAAVGDTISSTHLDGPDVDKESGSQTWTCTYTVTDGILAVSVAEFASISEARSFITLENLRKELKDVDIQVTEEKGLGDRAFLLTDEEGLSVTVLKGPRYYAVTAGGNKLPPDRLKTLLRNIATMLLPKL